MAECKPMILDTCALLWLTSGGKQLSRKTLQRIDRSSEIYLSAVSGFEIQIKVNRGNLKLPDPPEEWLKKVLQHHRISVIPADLDICMRSAGLSRIHDDPCDRLIIATALIHELEVVTRDERFAQYGVSVLC
jgi:PIN domain nuclease of toxin-antitoxin system